MVELSSQKDLLSILSKLFNDLSANNLQTLSEYKVDYSFQPPQPTSLICAQQKLLQTWQHSREYGFGPEADSSSRATAIHKLDLAVQSYLPTDNLVCEKHLAVFDKLAQKSASCSYRIFTAKGIRDEMAVYTSSPVC